MRFPWHRAAAPLLPRRSGHRPFIIIAMTLGLTGCSPGPYLFALADRQAASDLPTDCGDPRGTYFATHLDRGCAEPHGEIYACGEGSLLVQDSIVCRRDGAGQVWVAFVDFGDDAWSTLGWERCTADEWERVRDLPACATP